MPYALSHLGKTFEDLTYEDIEAYFKIARVESDKIEFKSYASAHIGGNRERQKEKLDAIAKTICGMLNSMGGLVIWGAPEGKDSKIGKEKVFQGDLSPVDELVEKDSFINSISDRITPSPSYIRFKKLEKDDRFVCLIEVDQSPYSPHQFQSIYWMRLDGQTRPAPHQYIEALFRKITFPRIEGYIKIQRVGIRPTDEQGILGIELSIWNLSMFQNEYDINFRLVVAPGRIIGSGGDGISVNEIELTQARAREILYFGSPYFKSVDIELTRSQLMSSRNIVEFRFHFAGKNSPMKFSLYRADISKNASEMIIYKSENTIEYDPIYDTNRRNLLSYLGNR